MRREHPSQQGYEPFSFQDTEPVSPPTAKSRLTTGSLPGAGRFAQRPGTTVHSASLLSGAAAARSRYCPVRAAGQSMPARAWTVSPRLLASDLGHPCHSGTFLTRRRAGKTPTGRNVPNRRETSQKSVQVRRNVPKRRTTPFRTHPKRRKVTNRRSVPTRGGKREQATAGITRGGRLWHGLRRTLPRRGRETHDDAEPHYAKTVDSGSSLLGLTPCVTPSHQYREMIRLPPFSYSTRGASLTGHGVSSRLECLACGVHHVITRK